MENLEEGRSCIHTDLALPFLETDIDHINLRKRNSKVLVVGWQGCAQDVEQRLTEVSFCSATIPPRCELLTYVHDASLPMGGYRNHSPVDRSEQKVVLL